MHESNELVKEAGYSAVTTRGNWLSYFAVCYSITLTWAGGAGDYYVMYPASTPSYKIFLVTFFGIAVQQFLLVLWVQFVVTLHYHTNLGMMLIMPMVLVD